jgi:hypothetical protein
MNSDIRNANRRAAWQWGSFVVGLLGLQVAGGVMAIMLATGDQSVAVVPDYHQKALDWDKEIALQSASRSLGWICEVSQIDSVSSDQATSDSPASPGLRIMLSDRQGEAITVASGELRFYRHARAADVQRVGIPAGTSGPLELENCFDADGLWQVMIDVTDREGNRFAHSDELVVRGVGRAGG